MTPLDVLWWSVAIAGAVVAWAFAVTVIISLLRTLIKSDDEDKKGR